MMHITNNINTETRLCSLAFSYRTDNRMILNGNYSIGPCTEN